MLPHPRFGSLSCRLAALGSLCALILATPLATDGRTFDCKRQQESTNSCEGRDKVARKAQFATSSPRGPSDARLEDESRAGGAPQSRMRDSGWTLCYAAHLGPEYCLVERADFRSLHRGDAPARALYVMYCVWLA